MDISKVRANIAKEYDIQRNWRNVADTFHISPAMAWRIVNQDVEPKKIHIRKALGLSCLALAPVCAQCGEVHTTKRCIKSAKHRKIKSLFDMKPKELKWAIENRVPFR